MISFVTTFYRVHLVGLAQSRDQLALVIADLFIYHLLSSSSAVKFNLQVIATVSYAHTIFLCFRYHCFAREIQVLLHEL